MMEKNIKNRNGLFVLFLLSALFFLPIASRAALTVIPNENDNNGQTLSADNVLYDIQLPNQKKEGHKKTQAALYQLLDQHKAELQNASITLDKFLFPATSDFVSGDVKKHRLNQHENKNTAQTNVSFYVVGDDERSIIWLKKNATYFKKIGAIGFLTNTQTKARAEEIEKETGATLMVVSLDGLENVVGTTHYPFLVYRHWVLQ